LRAWLGSSSGYARFSGSAKSLEESALRADVVRRPPAARL
jgi:hypothetical protein